MAQELQALAKNHTRDMVNLSLEKTIVGCKQIYKIKTHSDFTIKYHKARLVAQRFTLDYGID